MIRNLQHVDAIAGFALGGASCSVALSFVGSTPTPEVDAVSERSAVGQSQRALLLLQRLLAGRSMSPANLRAIAFDAGPGGFTGLRIGCALAQGLALALDLKVVPVPSGAALAWSLARQKPGQALRVIALQDARMGEVYGSLVDLKCGVEGVPEQVDMLGPSWVSPPEGVADRLIDTVNVGRSADRVVWVTGDALAVYPSLKAMLSRLNVGYCHWHESASSVSAAAVVELATWYLRQGMGVAAADAKPVYIRDKVALDVDEQQALRRQRQGA